MPEQFNSYVLRKLVRDTSLRNMAEKGAVVHYRTLDEKEFLHELLKKLQEEGAEALAAPDADVLKDELADLLEIIVSAAETIGGGLPEIENLRQAKREKRGGFSNRTFIEVVDCPVGSYWDVYFAKDPVTYGLVHADTVGAK